MSEPAFSHPPKWRETCDPFALHFSNFRLRTVLGYPHAGNDVFHVRGMRDGKEITAYLKVARGNNSARLKREAAVLSELNHPLFPKVIESGESFLLTEEMPGRRLSVIVGENEDMASLSYMEEYGEALSLLHTLSPSVGMQDERVFFRPPTADELHALNLSFLCGFFETSPSSSPAVFCHGDFHYANLLWGNHHLNAVLDFELCGYGNRDFDIAWALFLRPGQKFLKTDAERSRFLEGYRKHGDFDAEAVAYYTAQCYVHFLRFCGDDADYASFIREQLNKLGI